ncbi:MAG: hypothetical protein EXS63_02085 [Candidatus Omnitrophica bacterium]|nr:hypothetical protein [Candidatus Omnitrophota bacterium]
MVLSRKNEFQEQAAKVLASLYDSGDEAGIYKLLGEEDAAFRSVPLANFRANFLCARLALIAQTWEKSCQDAGLDIADLSKAFLRQVMSAFQSPKMLAPATTFSEYFSAPQIEALDSEATALAVLIFKHLGQKPTFEGEDKKILIRPAFSKLVAALESLRTTFENQFFEFLHLRPAH